MPQATDPWALDSGGFTELDKHGTWTLSANEYVAFVRRCVDEVGQLEWAAPQDWMCEPKMLAKTKLTIGQHQWHTVANLLRLRDLAPELPFIPVLQGWTLDEYLRCIELYQAAGVELDREPLVGVGTVCRRQDTAEAGRIMRRLASEGLRLHGFGVKVTGLQSYWDAMASCDSMAWSYRARKAARDGEPSCDPNRRVSCSNCLHFALGWLEDKVAALTDPADQPLWKETPCVSPIAAA